MRGCAARLCCMRSHGLASKPTALCPSATVLSAASKWAERIMSLTSAEAKAADNKVCRACARLRACVHVSVYVRACVRVCVCACLRVCACVDAHTRTRARAHTHTHTHTHTHRTPAVHAEWAAGSENGQNGARWWLRRGFTVCDRGGVQGCTLDAGAFAVVCVGWGGGGGRKSTAYSSWSGKRGHLSRCAACLACSCRRQILL